MNVFEGGFLGLDNIGPIDRSAQLPVAGRLAQADGTAWMAMYCLNLLEIALVLAEHDRVYEDMATKFLEHFAYIATASESLWDEEDGFYHDVLHHDDGDTVPLRVRSVVGLLPLAATTTLGPATLARLPDFAGRLRWFTANKPEFAAGIARTHERDGVEGRLLSVVPPERLARILAVMLDEAEFLSPHGLRALSAGHRDAAVHRRPGGHAVLGRLRTGRVDHRPVRRQLQLARPGVVPGQPPAGRSGRAVRPFLRRRRHRRVPHGLRPSSAP